MRWLPTLLCLFRFAAFGQEAATTDAHAEDRKALSKVMREVEASSNEQNIDRLLRQMDAGATVTWRNGDVSRGHADIKAYYERKMKLDGEVAIADGSSTLIRTSGEWKIVALHLPAIDEAKRGLWFVGLGGLSGGLLLGWFLDRMRQRFLRFFVKIRSGV